MAKIIEQKKKKEHFTAKGTNKQINEPYKR
jgi:hypothetical protein